MKAITYKKYGNPDVLEFSIIDKPVPGDKQVLVKVFAVSINDWDWGLLQGTPFANRMENGVFKPRKHKILGSDIAGVVEVTGKNVTKFKPGDEVFGDLTNYWGGFAEYVCAPENALALKPAGMTFEQAAAIPQAGMLAVQGLCDNMEMKPGQHLLINGAGGGVGTLGVQIAKFSGLEVSGVDSGIKLDMMLSLGFDHVIDYTKEDFTKTGIKYDLILDNKTNRSPFAYLRALKPNGVYVTTGGSIPRLLQAFLVSLLISLFSKKKIHIVILKPNKDLEYMKDLFEKGLKPVIDRPFILNELPEAMRYFGEGKHKGKLVITI